MDELNDLELGSIFSKCVFTVSTRLHSAIISMNVGTPALVFNYEHKSEGIMRRLGLDDLSQPLERLVYGDFSDGMMKLISCADSLRATINDRVAVEKDRANTFVRKSLSKIPV